MNIMITGCAGFIGSHAVDLFLEKGHNVVGVDCFTYAGRSDNILRHQDNDNFKLFNIDICDSLAIQELCELRKLDWIINFAAETHVDNSIASSKKFIHSNINGVRSILEACRLTSTKLFHISTDEVYGSIDKGEFNENSKLDPRNPYSATKAAAEHLVKAYHNTYGIDYIMVRPSNNMGPRQHGEKFLPTIIESLSQGNKVPIYGDGTNVREWLYVKDNVAAIEFLLKNAPLNQIYNITSSHEMRNIDVVKQVCEFLNRDFDTSIEFVKDRLGHDQRYSISNQRILDLGFNSFTKFDEALKQTVGWYNEKN